MHRQLFYLVGEAFRGLLRAKLSSLTSVLTIAISTAILGSFFIIVYSVLKTVDEKAEVLSLQVYINRNYETQDSLTQIKSQLEELEAWESVQFISKAQALEEFKRDFDPNMIDLLSSNPLPPSYEVVFKKQNLPREEVEGFRSRIELISGVEKVSGLSSFGIWKAKWRRPVIIISLIFLLILGGAVSLIISNTVKLNLLARKGLVDTMRYCGASGFFIVLPFLIEGLLIGMGGSLGGIIAGYLFSLWVPLWFPHILLPEWWMFSLSLLLFTSLLSASSGFFTVRRFIRLSH